MSLPVSIVINTYNRAATISNTLDSLAFLDYPNFEVIVVNGPSTDNTQEVLKRYGRAIKVGECPAANLSVSRNIGIAMAEGEIVAFIDDDAVPEPEWLGRIVAGYASEEVGGVGGFVYDHTGYSFQSRYILCDRVGNAVFGCEENPSDSFNFPFTRQYCSLMGTNATYRKKALLEAGGFDEYFAYFLDETDVCLRIVDCGYKVIFVDDAFVHHKFAPSHLRDTRRVLKDRTQIAKSKGYFTLRNSPGVLTLYEAFEGLQSWLEMVRTGLRWEMEHGLIDAHEHHTFHHQLDTGIEEGMREALSRPRQGLCETTLLEHARPFVPYPVKRTQTPRLTLCFLSQDYPPARYGGIGKWTREMAVELGSRGHYVHVVTRGDGHDRVDFEDGVWVHRIVPRYFPEEEKLACDVPDTIRCYALTAHQEVRRIARHHDIDLVSAPIWDLEGLACLADASLRTVVSLHTTFKLMLESHPEWNCDQNHRLNYIDKMIRAETWVLANAPWVMANSRGVVNAMRDAYGVELAAQRLGLVPHGIEDLSAKYAASRRDDVVRVLFVGRLEKRKGIDLLLQCIPGLCREFPQLQFVIAGEDDLQNEHGRTYREEFSSHSGTLLGERRVLFTGRVSDDELFRHYADCDIFAAPSLFESFGLIFIEAMMFGKPVIGSRAGGMAEVICDGANGFLVDPGNWESLYEALRKLVSDHELRRRFGGHSRRIFEQYFTCAKMVDQALAFYERILFRHGDREDTVKLSADSVAVEV